MEMKLASVIVTYHPNLSEVIDNLATYSDHVEVLMLWDNTEDYLDLTPLLQAYPNVVVHQSLRNEGLPAAYNWAFQKAKEYGCTHLMTMDQDSAFERFSAYRAWLGKKVEPCVTGIPINEGGRFEEEETKIGTVCQSGAVFPVEMQERIGGFREDLFIGMVDAEMSLRAAENGYAIIQYNGSNLKHKVGSGRKVRLLGHSLLVSDYNPLRHYYDSRNRILLWHEFPDDYNLMAKMRHLLGRVKLIVKIILFESNKWAKVSAIIKGTCYGFRNRAVPYKDKRKQ